MACYSQKGCTRQYLLARFLIDRGLWLCGRYMERPGTAVPRACLPPGTPEDLQLLTLNRATG